MWTRIFYLLDDRTHTIMSVTSTWFACSGSDKPAAALLVRAFPVFPSTLDRLVEKVPVTFEQYLLITLSVQQLSPWPSINSAKITRKVKLTPALIPHSLHGWASHFSCNLIHFCFSIMF